MQDTGIGRKDILRFNRVSTSICPDKSVYLWKNGNKYY